MPSSPKADAQPLGVFSPIQTIINRVEDRKGIWTGFKADLDLNFSNGSQAAGCSGTMTYHRLEEKILLACYDNNQNLLFSFNTHDRNFELYLPAQNTLFKGDIFDLEDAKDIELHLKPINLYRALKPMSLLAHQAAIEKNEKDSVVVGLYRKQQDQNRIVRELQISPQGDVSKETFFDSHEQPVVQIERNSFKERDVVGTDSKRKVVYPDEVFINTLDEGRQTDLKFKAIKFYTSLAEESWNLNIPTGTSEETIVSNYP
ncbi:MAG: hypothetical protein H6757_04240 [Candidatus Omnitrophica bacterium]|nr:hypothetical protein [Candidatus Omnitrophota bacterium]